MAPESFKDPLVKDLAWTLKSPSLLDAITEPLSLDDDWFTQQYLLFLPKLRSLDNNPEPLHQYFRQIKNQRLGAYFEAMIAFWLEHQNRYKLVFKNQPIRSAQSTVGEFDFIVWDNSEKIYCHWECAIKFYLGVQTLTDPTCWIGPGLKDQLSTKLGHLLNKQIQLSQTNPAKCWLAEHDIEISQRKIWLKGRLFYPLTTRFDEKHTAYPSLISPAHNKGYWLTQQQLIPSRLIEYFGPNLNYSVLTRNEWLALKNPVGKRCEELSSDSLGELNHPIQLAVQNQSSEIFHIFLVPNHWQTLALSQITGNDSSDRICFFKI